MPRLKACLEAKTAIRQTLPKAPCSSGGTDNGKGKQQQQIPGGNDRKKGKSKGNCWAWDGLGLGFGLADHFYQGLAGVLGGGYFGGEVDAGAFDAFGGF